METNPAAELIMKAPLQGQDKLSKKEAIINDRPLQNISRQI